MSEMRALTVQQPWAWAIAAQDKDVENRAWKTSYRGLLAIHAGRTGDDGARLPVERAARRFKTIRAESLLAKRISEVSLRFGCIVAVATLAGCHDERTEEPRNSCSPWGQPGQYHWQLANVRPLPEPVPCKGALGLWRLPEDVEKAVRAQLEDGNHG
jgi:hypothetical protein